MVKAKGFLDFLCNDLNIRFFSGVQCKGLSPIYDSMDPSIMHYVPAVSDEIALGMASGTTLAGIKSCILIKESDSIKLINQLKYNIENKTPVLIIAFNDSHESHDIHNYIPVERALFPDYSEVLARAVISKIPHMVVLNEGELI